MENKTFPETAAEWLLFLMISQMDAAIPGYADNMRKTLQKFVADPHQFSNVTWAFTAPPFVDTAQAQRAIGLLATFPEPPPAN